MMPGRPLANSALTALRRWVLWVLLAALSLQVFFVARIVLMAWVSPESTAFMRSEAWRRLHGGSTTATVVKAGQSSPRPWSQQWVGAQHISPYLKRAVIAAEDDGFTRHQGVDWAAMESAWQRNQQHARRARQAGSDTPLKVVGGSTITQQLAKNLVLSGERLLPRKAQELLLTLALEASLSKARILEIYLNSVEWGDGVFGAEAAARRYFGVSAAHLTAEQAARLAVMLPAPKMFERRPHSAYMNRRTEVILSRMPHAMLP